MLGAGQAQLIDRSNSVEILCSNPDARLFNADEDALAMGTNMALLGGEIIQFARADALGAGRYLLSNLLRGRRASEHAMAAHVAAEPFVLLDPHSLSFVTMDLAMLGANVEARAYGIADDEGSPPLAVAIAAGESLRPPSPCHLRGTISGSGIELSWVPRRPEAFAWVAGADPDTSGAHYSISISRSASAIIREVGVAALQVSAAELAALGSGSVSVAVSEAGANGNSRPVLLTIAA